MSDITARLRVESPTLALTEAVAYDDTATVRPVAGAGTVPDSDRYLFTVRSADFDRFEAGAERDGTVAAYERVVGSDDRAVYSFAYTADATLFSPAIAAVNGVSREWTNDGTAWAVEVWLPSRSGLARLQRYAADNGIEFTLEAVADHTDAVGTGTELTDKQEAALRVALTLGYFEEPRGASLSRVAEELGISQPAAGGRLRRGIRRLVASATDGDGSA
jgi:predicted DNA binding protein